MRPANPSRHPFARLAAYGRAAASVLTLTLGLPAAASADSGSFRIDVHSDEGDDVHISIGSGFASAMIRTLAPLAIDCDDSADDPEVRRLFREMDRAGELSTGTLRDDGDLLEARREHGKLELKVTDGEDGEVARISMPWTVARCLLGGEKVSRGELARAFEDGEFEIHVEDGEDEARIDVH
jgi:hypothetical protein